MFRTLKKYAVSAAVLGGMVAVSQVAAMPAANAAPPEDCPNYPVAATTDTDLTISPGSPDVGESFRADATVAVADAPATGGDVTFTFVRNNGNVVDSDTVAVVAGEATTTFTVPSAGEYTVRAVYSGQCLPTQISFGTSSDRVAIVAGVQAGGGGGAGAGGGGAAGGGAAGGGAVGGVLGGLGDTGLGSQAMLFGLLGAGLVTVGGLTLVVYRRRVEG